jgi:hypothetical protein
MPRCLCSVKDKQKIGFDFPYILKVEAEVVSEVVVTR